MSTTSQSSSNDPRALRAQGHRLIAEGNTLLAKAEEIAATPPSDPWIVLKPKEPIEGFGLHGRIVVDAAARGEIALSRAGGKPMVRRSELERWLEGRRKVSKRTPKERDDSSDDYGAIVAGARP